MRCPACNVPNPDANKYCHQCGEKLPSSASPAAEEVLEVLPALPVSAESGDTHASRLPEGRDKEDEDTDVVLTLIPYKNPRALAAYYCGFFALVPVIGFILAVVAIVLGIMGLQYASANPKAKGAAHAITGLILGVVALCWNTFFCLVLYLAYGLPW
jgi:hypothetical protein